MNYRRVELDILPYLRFIKSDTLSFVEKKEREHQLISATALTCLDHEDVGLIVKLENGEEVELVCNRIDYEGDFVELKGGYTIPIRAIVKVEI